MLKKGGSIPSLLVIFKVQECFYFFASTLVDSTEGRFLVSLCIPIKVYLIHFNYSYEFLRIFTFHEKNKPILLMMNGNNCAKA